MKINKLLQKLFLYINNNFVFGIQNKEDKSEYNTEQEKKSLAEEFATAWKNNITKTNIGSTYKSSAFFYDSYSVIVCLEMLAYNISKESVKEYSANVANYTHPTIKKYNELFT